MPMILFSQPFEVLAMHQYYYLFIVIKYIKIKKCHCKILYSELIYIACLRNWAVSTHILSKHCISSLTCLRNMISSSFIFLSISFFIFSELKFSSTHRTQVNLINLTLIIDYVYSAVLFLMQPPTGWSQSLSRLRPTRWIYKIFLLQGNVNTRTHTSQKLNHAWRIKGPLIS